MNKVYDKSSEGKKKNFQEEIDAILKERDVFEQAVKNGIRTQKEFDDYSQKSAVAIKKLREDQQKIDKAGSKSAEAAANRAAKALAAYDEEIAKLTQSSRELEQVKIEEKLAKIARTPNSPPPRWKSCVRRWSRKPTSSGCRIFCPTPIPQPQPSPG
ncbi:MAG: hypothetical protein ACLSAH_20870 [Bilophila wadsworthia]